MYRQPLEMSEGEIRRYYKWAKNKGEIITILADLNCCNKKIIKGILDGEISMDGKEAILHRKNLDNRSEYRRKYYLENRERILADQKERYQRNREQRLEYSREYSKKCDRSKYYSKRYYDKKAKKEECAVV